MISRVSSANKQKQAKRKNRTKKQRLNKNKNKNKKKNDTKKKKIASPGVEPCSSDSLTTAPHCHTLLF